MLVTNNFLPPQAFKDLQEYCNTNEFEIVQVGEKQFSVLETPRNLLEFFQLEDYELVLTFVRSAKVDFDTKLNIHADNIVNGRKIALASVLYINNDDEVASNGTAFYKHHTHGYELSPDVTNEEFDRLLTDDSWDMSKWEGRDIVFSRPNKRLLYNANSFHAKFPAKIDFGIRKVLICFYSIKN